MDNYTIIPIGETCNISFLLQNCKLKKETTLFEWFISETLDDITNVLIQIITKTDGDIIKQEGEKIYMNSTIHTSHYTLSEFKPIYERRRNRLIESIQNKNLLFIRFDKNFYLYNKEDIDNFIRVIKVMNPDANIKLLLISPNYLMIDHPSVICVFYDKHHEDPYCKGEEINELFINALQRVGYDISSTNDIIFDDKSTI
jgi:hypothetical protein